MLLPYAITAVVSSGLTTSVIVTLVWRLKDRLVMRLETVRLVAQAGQRLENARLAHDSGRDNLVRPDGGKPGKVVDGMGHNPGVMERYLRDK